MKYNPIDNSWCINLATREGAYLASRYCDKKEINAEFEIVSEPYDEVIIDRFIHITIFVRKFVNVKSSKTGNIYRTLYYPNQEY